MVFTMALPPLQWLHSFSSGHLLQRLLPSLQVQLLSDARWMLTCATVWCLLVFVVLSCRILGMEFAPGMTALVAAVILGPRIGRFYIRCRCQPSSLAEDVQRALVYSLMSWHVHRSSFGSDGMVSILARRSVFLVVIAPPLSVLSPSQWELQSSSLVLPLPSSSADKKKEICRRRLLSNWHDNAHRCRSAWHIAMVFFKAVVVAHFNCLPKEPASTPPPPHCCFN
jgi:hypothetical protein